MNSNLVYDTKKIKDRVSMDQIVSMYTQINNEHKIICPFHDDHNPSFHIYEQVGKCYACGTVADIFSFVMKMEGLSFLQAVKFIADKEGILPQPVITATSTDYRGDVPGVWISHWHDQLTPERREYLHKRLLTDEFIDSHMLGFDPEKTAYTIPFYKGHPGNSPIEIFQYRAAPDKIWDDPNKIKRYWGKRGYNRPAILGRHLINSELVIILFGSIDQLNAEQDGLPAISISAIEGFSDPKSDQCIELQKLLSKTKNIVVIPDATLSEFTAASRLADLLGAKVCYFPKDCGAKDYNEYRQQGNTAEDFIREVLQMNDFLWVVDADHVQRVWDILDEIADGHGEGALTILQVIVTEKKYNSSLVNRALQYACTQQPFKNDKFTPEEWNQLADEIFECRNYLEMLPLFKEWSDKALEKEGAF